MARYVAKNIVAAGLSKKCQVQLAYAIGMADPISILIDDFGTAKVSCEKIATAVREVVSLKPKNIISHLNLLRPIFKKTASYGHFGRSEPEFTWEKTDLKKDLLDVVGKIS